MRPAGVEPFARRHRAAPAGPHDAFDERAFADELHDDQGADREDGHDGDHGELRGGEAEAVRPTPTAVAAAATPTARHADEKPEQPERFAGPGVVEPLFDDLGYGHALL